MNKKKLLLHSCCGPCTTVPVERLWDEYEIVSFEYNPNIHPETEHQLRLTELDRLTDELGIDLIVAEYDPERWFSLVKGLETEPEGGERCAICFRMRLERAAMFAKENGFDFYTTTLTISPHKNAERINKIGAEIARQHGVNFLECNFKKKDGYSRSIELSKAYQLYRQNYCGCIYSRRSELAERG
ncbi:MAG: epoxyqueuosine reductase QueH [Candidatus Zhuqueibacterota bacterium]